MICQYCGHKLTDGKCLNPAYVQQQLGHSSLRMTLDIYGHYIPKTSTRRGVDVLDERKEMEG